ncbi:hypothetical protein VNO80_02069 [Phaseolus coccineus]|uniref:non-specific serine/threonine protein kinase n=1 Tax=Phaseolus coccineus TaxID=3886 RepID=A0AAN9RHM1_PHACN
MSCFCSGTRGKDVGIESLGSNSKTKPKKASATSYSFRELATAARGFKEENLIGEGGFGKVYKGRLSTGQLVAIKQLRLDGESHQGNREFVTEVLMLSLLHHSNLVKLFGYCTHGDQRLLVYEYMAMGSLEQYLSEKNPLGWRNRLKIGVGAARGLQYLHCVANPPVIYRDLKSANILLDNNLHPKLSDFGLAKLGPVGDNTHVSTRVMGTYGYCAPEYAMSGKLTLKSDIYCFGVVLLELITGRKAMDVTRKQREQSLVAWARPYLSDRRKVSQIVDPLLEGRYPLRCLQNAIAITAMCLQEQPNLRPSINDIVVALEYLASESSEVVRHRARTPPRQSHSQSDTQSDTTN